MFFFFQVLLVRSKLSLTMFKIKKSAKRVGVRQPLADANKNQQSRQTVRPLRPSSVRMLRKDKTSTQLISNKPDPSQFISNTNMTEIRAFEPRTVDRETLEYEIRRLSAIKFKDRITAYGQFKEDLIRRVTEKSMFKPQTWGEEGIERLNELIQTQVAKVEKAREAERRYQETQSKIEKMFDDRLIRLGAFR